MLIFGDSRGHLNRSGQDKLAGACAPAVGRPAAPRRGDIDRFGQPASVWGRVGSQPGSACRIDTRLLPGRRRRIQVGAGFRSAACRPDRPHVISDFAAPAKVASSRTTQARVDKSHIRPRVLFARSWGRDVAVPLVRPRQREHCRGVASGGALAFPAPRLSALGGDDAQLSHWWHSCAGETSEAVAPRATRSRGSEVVVGTRSVPQGRRAAVNSCSVDWRARLGGRVIAGGGAGACGGGGQLHAGGHVGERRADRNAGCGCAVRSRGQRRASRRAGRRPAPRRQRAGRAARWTGRGPAPGRRR